MNLNDIAGIFQIAVDVSSLQPEFLQRRDDRFRRRLIAAHRRRLAAAVDADDLLSVIVTNADLLQRSLDAGRGEQRSQLGRRRRPHLHGLHCAFLQGLNSRSSSFILNGEGDVQLPFHDGPRHLNPGCAADEREHHAVEKEPSHRTGAHDGVQTVPVALVDVMDKRAARGLDTLV